MLKEDFEATELNKTTPYMLRNDGALLTCGENHPYVKLHFEDSIGEAIVSLTAHPNFIEWFYRNTLNSETIDRLNDFLNLCELTPEIIDLKKRLKIPETSLKNIDWVIYELINLTNQEFCRVRTSNFKYKYGGDNGEIYFRISSKNFNWFDLIWQIAYKFKASIKYITIMKDHAATGEKMAYIQDGKNIFNKMPIDEFLMLEGKPMIEDLEKPEQQIEEDIERHQELNPKLFDEDAKLKSEVRTKILQIAKEFLDDLADDDIEIKVKDIILVGSNVSYNYTKDSDLDIHILADVKNLDNPELYPLLYGAYRSLFNKKFDELNFYGIPVEIYVETDDTPLVSNGIYSIKNNNWIKEPELQEIPEIDHEAFDREFKIWEDKYNQLVDKFQSKLSEKLTEDYIVYETMNDLEKAYDAYKACKDSKQKKELENAVKIALFQVRDDISDSKKDLARWQKIKDEFDNKKINESHLVEYVAGEMFRSPSKKMDALAKMRAFNNGTRKENLGAAGTDKLKDYLKLCNDEMLTIAAAKIEDELKARGELPPIPGASISSGNPVIHSTSIKPNIDINIRDVLKEVSKFRKSNISTILGDEAEEKQLAIDILKAAAQVYQQSNLTPLDLEQNLKTSLVCAFIARYLNLTKTAGVLIQELRRAGMGGTFIESAIYKATADSTITNILDLMF